MKSQRTQFAMSHEYQNLFILLKKHLYQATIRDNNDVYKIKLSLKFHRLVAVINFFYLLLDSLVLIKFSSQNEIDSTVSSTSSKSACNTSLLLHVLLINSPKIIIGNNNRANPLRYENELILQHLSHFSTA